MPNHPHMGAPRFPAIPGYEFVRFLGFACGGRVVCSSLFLARHLRSNALAHMAVSNQLGPDRFPGRLPASAHGLKHPNILRVIDVGEHEGYSYEAIEAVEGGKPLSDLLREGPLSTMQARAFVRSVISALQFAADRGMYHRSLTPRSISVSEGNVLKLHVVDFSTTDGLPEHPYLDSPANMPPEVVSGAMHAATSPAAQVYTVGTVLYEMLTRHPPFVGQSKIEVLQRVLRDAPVPPSEIVPTVPADLEEVCMRCLAKQPQLRYRTLQQLADVIVSHGEQAAARR
jgi:eukaryotic-like serine/threonine-protein kinase